MECYDVDMTEPEPAVGGGGLLWWPAGVLIRGGCTLERGERGERGEHQGLEIMVLSLPVVASRPLHSAQSQQLCSLLTISGKTRQIFSVN